MKKKLIFALSVGLLVIMLIGCYTTKKVTTEKPISVEKKSGHEPEIYLQSKLTGMTQTDSVKIYKKALFYNSAEISVEKVLGSRTFDVDDNGEINVVDSISQKQKIVDPFTPGGIQEIKVFKNYRGIISVVIVSFSKNDATYKFNFHRQQDGKFLLNGNALIVINDHPYRVIAKTNVNCYLYFYLNKKQIIDKSTEKAEGWNTGAVNSTPSTKSNGDDYNFQPSVEPTR